MKKRYLSFLFVLTLFAQCSDDKKAESEKDAPDTLKASVNADAGAAVKENGAVCIWEKLVVRETPEEKGKYVTTVNLAEKVELLNESKVDESTAKKREYIKIKLIDGKEGWVVKDFIATNARAGAILKDMEIYTRPDLLSKSNKTFKRMDVVGVSDCQGEWCKITGKRTDGTWIDQGWVKTADLSYDEKDIAVAIYLKQALGQSNEEKMLEELNKIAKNSDFQGSVFLSDVNERILALTTDPNEGMEDAPDDTLAIEGDI